MIKTLMVFETSNERMKMQLKKYKLKEARGFSLVEGVLVLVIVAGIAFAGWYVYHRDNKSNYQPATSYNSQPTAKPGTTASIDQLTSQEISGESAAMSNYSNAAQSASTSDSSALNNLGASYNENNF